MASLSSYHTIGVGSYHTIEPRWFEMVKREFVSLFSIANHNDTFEYGMKERIDSLIKKFHQLTKESFLTRERSSLPAKMFW